MQEAKCWDERYEQNETPWDTGEPSPELIRVVTEEKIAPCRVIELGCGTGTNCAWLAKQHFEVTGVDFSARAIQRAKEASAGLNIHFIQADVTDLPDLGEPFPFFFDRGCYHVVRQFNVDGYLRSLQRVIAPNGIGLILAGNAREPKEEMGPPVVTEEEIRGEIGRVFDIVWLREFRFHSATPDGRRFLAWSCFVRKK